MNKQQLTELIEKYFTNHSEIRVLDAGCGSEVHLELSKKLKITGLDISIEQLERNNYISDKICTDLQTYNFQDSSFDVIICWYVLEHIKYPRNVILKFIKALEPNGLLFLALPNIWSVKGIITKFTPTFIHIWFYRNILKYRSAGINGNGPFKTYLKKDISPNKIKQLAHENNLEIVYFSFENLPDFQRKIKQNLLMYVIQAFVSSVLWLFSFGKIKLRNPNFVVVLEKTT
ncbi:MAG TPA: class I SAM-dependent methyltransferase [Prolixibacteraceae bacterium]|nr:class I SAM-dependent methyltransferase [Prolixibacteraceae bacterium]